MITLFVTDHHGKATERTTEPSRSLMQALKSFGYDLQAICGGSFSCATCHVYVDASDPPLATPCEDEIMLASDSDHYIEGRSRLSCQILLTSQTNSLTITLAPDE